MVTFGGPTRGHASKADKAGPKKEQFQLLYVAVLREYFDLEFAAAFEGKLPFEGGYDLERVIDHATTTGSQSVLDGPSGRQLTEYGSGAFYVSYQDTALAAWKFLAQGGLAAELTPELRFLSSTPRLNLDDVKREVSGSTIASFLRTAKGLMFRAESR